MSPYAKRARVFRRKGDEVRRTRGRTVKDRRRGGAPGLHAAKRRKIGEGATQTARLRSLTVRGMCPLKPVHARSTSSVTAGVNQRPTGRRTSGRKGPWRPSGPKRSAAREHEVARRRGAGVLRQFKKEEERLEAEQRMRSSTARESKLERKLAGRRIRVRSGLIAKVDA